MISDVRLKEAMEKRFDKYVSDCSSLETLRADGYADCYNDMLEIVEEMASEYRIRQSARRKARKLLGR